MAPTPETTERAAATVATTATIEKIYVSRRSAAPMESRQSVVLLPGRGIDGDRYATRTGTYSARFLSEPGRNLTMVSSEGIAEAFSRTGMAPLGDPSGPCSDLRRNLVLSGISAEALNAMVGHEVAIGREGRVFVHRRCVPCRYREAACKRSGLTNNLWGVSGISCEVLPPRSKTAPGGTTIQVGDEVAVVPGTHAPDRIDVGRTKPGSFVRPADRSAEDVKKSITPPYIAALASLWDPEGFARVEAAHNSVGLRFWTPEAYQVGLLAAALRVPLMLLLALVAGSALAGLGVLLLRSGGREAGEL